jgi:hypothetical protein
MADSYFKMNGNVMIQRKSGIDSQFFYGPNHNFEIRVENSPIIGTTNSSENNPTSDQLAIYNGATKLWGITEGGYVQNPNRPAFYVRNTAGASAFAASSVMTWDEIHFNIGNHFSNGTTFTAPVDGIYFFSSQILSNANSRVYHRLRKNGSGIVGTYTESYSGTSYQTVTISIVYQLNAGDYVDSYCYSNAAYGSSYANFNGCLIG